MDRIEFTTGVAAGGAGVATATGYSPVIRGQVLAVAVEYLDSPPAATTDFTLQDEMDPLAENIITLVDQSTDIKLYPRRATEENDGTAIVYVAGVGVYEPYAVHGRLVATIAQANDGDSCTVTVWFE